MGIEYYGFAFFIFVLICIVIFLCSYLFSDLKRQKKLLDEKETKLLKLYLSLEDAMDEFYDSIAESKEEIDARFQKLQTAVESDLKTLSTRAVVLEERKEFVQKPEGEQNPDFPKTAQETAKVDFRAVLEQQPQESAKGEETAKTRHESILLLAKQGKNYMQIAKELNITQTEVSLVVGMGEK